MTALDREVARVVAAGACSGCGACTRLDDALEMRLDAAGFLRPVRVRPAGADGSRAAGVPDAVARFRASCPGVVVRAVRPAGVPRHPLLGPVLGSWRAWAADPVTRRLGSSGGALTALAAWLLETGEAATVVGAQAADEPRRTVSVELTTREQALAAAGSRYAPVAAAACGAALDPAGAAVGKPCEVAALRALAGEDAPLLLSFFCAGTPSQHATDTVLAGLGIAADEPLASLRYRGDGWPGRFRAVTADGRDVSTTYDESWGTHLGPTVQWRCKICPDGVGEHSDVTAADVWRTDERGYPVFTEGDGTSALLARTPRGLDAVLRAQAAGVLALEPLDLAELVAVQPLQRTRRTTLAGRLLGARVGGLRPPWFPGFGLLRLALGDPRAALRTARGTARRARQLRARSAAAATPAPATDGGDER